MKKVFGLFLSLIVLMGLSACKKGYSTLTFVASGESSVTLVKVGEPFDISLEYSMDGKNWKPYTIGETIFLLEDKLSFRAEESGNKRFSKGDDNYYQFKISGKIAAKGSIMSLLDRNCGKNAVPSYAFVSLFCECTTLTEAPELPATELAESCYSGMFFYCTSLTKAPELPAKELASWCYFGMFSGCKSLTKAPMLPATELAPSCYAFMLQGCESLTKAPTLPAAELAPSCYAWMFEGCTNLTEAPTLPATELAEGCYGDMFRGCTSLTKAPDLPATKLAESCYSGMFYGCTRLTKAPELPAKELAPSCYAFMLKGCESLTKAPTLPAKELAENCYKGMFSLCHNLSYIKALFVTPPFGSHFDYRHPYSPLGVYSDAWLWNVARTGTFVKSKDATWDVRGASGVPEGWTVLTE